MKQNCRLKRTAFFLSVSLLVGMFSTSLPVWAELSVKDFVHQAQNDLAAQQEGTYSSGADWNWFALARSGAPELDGTGHIQKMGTYLTETIDEKGHLTYATDYARMVLTAGALGYDAQQFAGVDLIGELSRSELVEKQGINGYIYTLTALDSRDYTLPDDAVWTVDNLVERVCALQKDKGYFVYTDSFGADVDLTAMAVTALAPHCAQEPAKTAVDKAVSWLATVQLDTAGFAAMGKENSLSAAQVLTALCAVGTDPLKDARFLKQGNSILDNLAGYAAPGGGFRIHQENTEADEMATAQVLYALAALERLQIGKASLFDLRDVPEMKPVVLGEPADKPEQEDPPQHGLPSGSVLLAVTASNAQRGVLLKPAEQFIYQGDTPYTLLERTLGKENVETTGSGTSVYISGIKNKKGWLREFDFGPQSGWKYSVNGQFVSQGAGAYPLEDGDTVYWYYTTGQESDVTDASAFENLPVMVSDLYMYPLILKKEETLTEWELVYLSMVDMPVSRQIINERVREAEGSWRKITDLERVVIAAAAIGKDPRNIEGYHLIDQIVNSDRMMNQGANGPIYALVALDCKQFPVPDGAVWTREKLVETVLAFQNADGSFALVQGEDSNVDVTAMALQALSGYVDQAAVKQAVDRALDFLSQAQEQDGGYSLYGEKNCESNAQVVLALQSLGIDPELDERFIKHGISVLDAMLAYAVEAPAGIWKFRHVIAGETDEIATEQGYLAAAATQKTGRWFDFGKADETVPGYGTITDLNDASDWAQDSIAQAVELGIIKGYADGRFAPQQPITRAEFLALLVRMLDYQLMDAGPLAQPPSVFPDVSETDWFYDELAIAASNGLVLADQWTAFRPNDPLTREEMAVFLKRTYLFDWAYSADLLDDESISEWAKISVYSVYQAGIMQGDGGYFDPQGMVTREMVAVVGMRLHHR